MPLCITRGVFQLNETMFWYDDCVFKGSPPTPHPPTCGTSRIPLPHKTEFNVGHYVQIQGYASKSVHIRESCLRESCLRGGSAHCYCSCLSPLT